MLSDVGLWSTFRKYKWEILPRSSLFLYLQTQQHRVGPEDQAVNLERCFHWWLNGTNSFPTISQPCSQTLSRQPIPTGLLSVGLWAYSATWGFWAWDQTGNHGPSPESSPGPTMSACQVTCALILSLYPFGLLWWWLFLLWIYFDFCGRCVKDTRVCLWGQMRRLLLWNSSLTHSGWATRLLHHVPMASRSVSLTLYFSHLSPDLFLFTKLNV